MIEKRALIGSTIKLTYNFYSRDDLVTLASVDYPVIKVFDYNRVQIGTDVTLTAANKIEEGSFFYQLVVPNNPPYIDVECTAANGGYPDVSRDHIELYWSENDMSEAPTVTLVEGTNTYISLANANTYMDMILSNTAWTSASENDKSKALIKATKNIDNLLLKGIKRNTDQPLQFPRFFEKSLNYDDIALLGTEQDIPTAVAQACAEEALAILRNFSTPNIRLEFQQQGVKSVRIGNTAETYTTPSSLNSLLGTETRLLLKGYIANSVPISRGRC